MNALSIGKIISESERKLKIKLIGDSITHGQGGTGFSCDGEQFFLTVRRNPNGYCWANLFKEHLEKKYSCEVINNGICGNCAAHFLINFNAQVDADDDVVFCMLGTNDRSQRRDAKELHASEEHLNIYSNNVDKICEFFHNKGIDNVVLMSCIPAIEDCETPDSIRHFKACDIDTVVRDAAEKYGFPFISMYTLVCDWCEKNKAEWSSFLVDRVHPNDAGYKVMFDLIIKELGL